MITTIEWNLSAEQETGMAKDCEKQGLWSQAAIHWRQAATKAIQTRDRDMCRSNANIADFKSRANKHYIA